MFAEPIDQFGPAAANRDQDAECIEIDRPPPRQADEEHQREVEVEQANQVFEELMRCSTMPA